jgi:hypothetical protein
MQREADSMRPETTPEIDRRLAHVAAVRRWRQRNGTAPAYLTLSAHDAHAVEGGTLTVYRESRSTRGGSRHD